MTKLKGIPKGKLKLKGSGETHKIKEKIPKGKSK